MTRPVFVLDPDRFVDAGSTVVLDGPEGRHAAVVRRIGVGERVDLVDAAGRRAEATVASVENATLTVRLDRVHVEDEPSPRLVLVQALAKGDRDDQAVEAATELGVDGIVPWQAARSIVQWRGPRGEKAHRKWVDQVHSAAKQSRRARFPQVEPLVDTTGLARRVASADLAFILHEEADTPLVGAQLPEAGEVLLVVGPEGGITPEELALLQDAGGLPVRLGPTVLRSSSAGPAALAVLSADARWR